MYRDPRVLVFDYDRLSSRRLIPPSSVLTIRSVVTSSPVNRTVSTISLTPCAAASPSSSSCNASRAWTHQHRFLSPQPPMSRVDDLLRNHLQSARTGRRLAKVGNRLCPTIPVSPVRPRCLAIRLMGLDLLAWRTQ